MKAHLIIISLLAMASSNLCACNKAGSTAGDSVLTGSEKQGLTFMREEEKLAHDVYVLMYSKWGLIQFNHISQSESSHMTAVKTLLDRYSLPDPSLGMLTGEFKDPQLQALYIQLMNEGNKSDTSALRVGAAIEEIDIRDIKMLANSTANTYILAVYENLVRGSRNHLRAFVSTLSTYGINYVPQYLTQAEFDAIINSPMEPGNRGRN